MDKNNNVKYSTERYGRCQPQTPDYRNNNVQRQTSTHTRSGYHSYNHQMSNLQSYPIFLFWFICELYTDILHYVAALQRYVSRHTAYITRIYTFCDNASCFFIMSRILKTVENELIKKSRNINCKPDFVASTLKSTKAYCGNVTNRANLNCILNWIVSVYIFHVFSWPFIFDHIFPYGIRFSTCWKPFG